MNLSCERTRLVDAMATCKGALASRSPREAWRHYLMTVCMDSRSVEFTATNGEVQIDSVLMGDMSLSGCTCQVLVPPVVLDILRAATGEHVELSLTDGGILHIECGGNKWDLQTLSPDEFSEIEHAAGEKIAIPSGMLRDAIARTVHATDPASTRMATGGVLICPPHVAATDGRRLSVVSLDGCPGFYANPVVPDSACKRLLSLIGDESMVTIVAGENAIRFELGDVTLTSRLVDGRFPPFEAVVDQAVSGGAPVDVTVSVDGLASALKQAMYVTREESRGVDLEIGNEVITMSASVVDVGNAETRCRVLSVGEGHGNVTISLDPHLLMEYLQSVRGDTQVRITSASRDGNSAVVFRSAEHHTYIIMPLLMED